MKFLKIVSRGVRHEEDHHYEIPLPFRDDSQWFPDNRGPVLQRALWLRKKLIKNEKFYKDYVNVMSSIIAKGFARYRLILSLQRRAKSGTYPIMASTMPRSRTR